MDQVADRDEGTFYNPLYDHEPGVGEAPFYCSEKVGEVIGAFYKAVLRGLPNPAKNAENPFFHSKYMPLESILNLNFRKFLAEFGLVLMQPLRQVGGRTLVVSTLFHTSGQWISSTVEAKGIRADPQSAGSALTYFRRYAVLSLLGLAPEDEDDDGNLSSRDSGGHVDSTSPGPISVKQVSFLFHEAEKNGWSPVQVREYVRKMAQLEVEEIQWNRFDALLKIVRGTRPAVKKE